MLLVLASCRADMQKTDAEDFKRTITGQAQGTTYRITYYDLQERDFKPEVDSILARIDASLSTYLEGSVIDQWNRSDSGAWVDDLFLELLQESYAVYVQTDGAFDPTVKPLVSYWGFGPERYQHPEAVDSQEVVRLLQLVQFDTLALRSNKGSVRLADWKAQTTGDAKWFLEKPIPGMQLDFNAIGQGWSVDKVADHLRAKGIKVFFVELGGEIVAGSPKPDGSLWRFGIDKPTDQNHERVLQAIVKLRNKGLATSGGYRKFYERDGVRYSHTIHPKTGYPVQHNLLSASVVASNAGQADAFATAFMVMGQDSAMRYLQKKDYLDTYTYLISAKEDGSYDQFISKELEGMMEEDN